jgi:hypothetical protein
MANSLSIKQGALEPDFEVELWDDTVGEPIPLPEGSFDQITVRIAKPGKTIAGICELRDGVDERGEPIKKVAYRWAEGDTSTPGKYRAEITVWWAGTESRPQIVPNSGYYEVTIEPKA